MTLDTLKQKTSPHLSYQWHPINLNKRCYESPSARWGHSMVLAENDIYVFGGYADSQYMNDLWRFSIKESIWKKLNPGGDIPEKRSNHCSVYDPLLKRILFFGGGSTSKKRFNDTYAYDVKTGVFQLLETSGILPVARTYHTTVLLDRLMIVFGGESTADRDDLSILDLETNIWTEPEIKGKKPGKRRFHSAGIVGSKMFIFGGCHGSYKCLNDFFMIDFESYLENPEQTKLEWVEYKADKSFPIARWGHACISHLGNIYIIGGRNTIDFNDVHRFCLSESKWEKVITEGETPTERRRHTVEVCGNQVVLFGGFNGTYFNSMYYLNIPEEAPDNILHNSQAYKQKLYAKKRLFDVDFNVEGKILSAHRTVLYMTDPGFSKILDKEESLIELKDIKYKYFSGIVNYCYTKTFAPVKNFLSMNFLTISKKNSNLGYLLNIRFTAQSLGLSSIEKEVAEILHQRSKKNKPVKPKIVFPLLFKKSVKPVFECPEEETVCETVIVEKTSPIKYIWKKYLEISQFYTDCRIQVQENISFACHKVMLVSSGKFFKNLFLLGFMESHNRDINLREINPKIFEYILCFIYFEDEFLNLPANTLKEQEWIALLKTTQYLTLEKLQSFCERSLVELLTIENVFSLLDLAIIYNFEILEKGCLQFITSNYYSVDLKKEFIQYMSQMKTIKGEEDYFKMRIQAYCEKMKFHIYQKGVVFKNCQSENIGLSEILFGNSHENKRVKTIFDREIEESKLNSLNDLRSNTYK